MKKIIFRVSSPKENSIVSLIKEVNKISCRINLDLENGIVTVENVNDDMIDNVIELIDNYYTILGVNIDNTSEGTIQEQKESAVSNNVIADVKDTIAELQPKILEPQSEDDLIIKKVEFENEYVQGLINKFLRTAYWAMFKMNVPEKEIGNFIYTSIDEISMRYNPKEPIKFCIGDVVDCNYGTHLNGEINGYHVSAIVCNISTTGMVYLIPITKMQTDITSYSYLIFNTPEDVVYENDYYKGGTALIDKAKFVRPERIHAVIGKTTPDFFKKVLYKLASTFDFTSIFDENIDKVVLEEESKVDKLSEEKVEVIEQPVAVNEEKSDEPIKKVKEKTLTKKIGGEEEALLKAIGPSFDKLDKSKKVEEQVEDFMNEIGMPTSANLVTQSFVIACDIKKINYENVILELCKLNPNIRDEIIKASLKENFKKWLEQYPEILEKCPKISLMSMLKVFAKRFSKEDNC